MPSPRLQYTASDPRFQSFDFIMLRQDTPPPPLHRRAAGVPAGGLLVGVAGPQNRGFVKGAAGDLQAQRQPVVAEAAGDGQRRDVG